MWPSSKNHGTGKWWKMGSSWFLHIPLKRRRFLYIIPESVIRNLYKLATCPITNFTQVPRQRIWYPIWNIAQGFQRQCGCIPNLRWAGTAGHSYHFISIYHRYQIKSIQIKDMRSCDVDEHIHIHNYSYVRVPYQISGLIVDYRFT